MKKLAVILFSTIVIYAYAADKWIDQIEILMTEKEKSDYEKLKSDPEKQKFVNDFWARRDPSPGTPENEYKVNYEKNFAQVNSMMKDDRGFRTDIGQTLLLLGQPTEQKQEKPKAEDEEEESTPGKQTWVYKSLPREIAAGEVTIEFHAEGNQWRFADKKQVQALLEKARQRTIEVAIANQKLMEQQKEETKAQAASGGLPPLRSPEVKTALDATVAGNPPKAIEMKAMVDWFMTSTGESFATIAIQSANVPSGAKSGIRVLDSSGASALEAELPFVDSSAKPAEPTGYFQTSIPIKAGEYSVAVVASSGSQAGGVKETLIVPEYEGKFAMSSIILAKGHQQISEAKPEKTPYTFGKIKLNPNVNRTFTKSDELFIMYEAYNFQLDPSGKPNVEARISFQKENESPKQLPAGPANGLVTGKKMTVPTGFSLQEKLFTPGNWKISITLTDKISGQIATREAGFTIQ